jgi:hypothetical protein
VPGRGGHFETKNDQTMAKTQQKQRFLGAEMAVKSLVSYFIPAKSHHSFVIIGRFGYTRQ